MIDPSDVVCGLGNDEKTEAIDHDGVIRQTDQAVLFDIDGDEVWIPKSVLREIDDDHFEAAMWFLEREGMI